jgi:hypothetical protein
MTTKKSKNYDLTKKSDLKYKPKEAKKKTQNTKRIDTFLPISNEETKKQLTSVKS